MPDMTDLPEAPGDDRDLTGNHEALQRLVGQVADLTWPRAKPVDYQDQAKRIVRAYAQEHLDKSDPSVDFEVYVVWFAKTLGNWKALVSTTLPDGRYYEVTHNGATGETYLDAYVKLENRVLR